MHANVLVQEGANQLPPSFLVLHPWAGRRKDVLIDGTAPSSMMGCSSGAFVSFPTTPIQNYVVFTPPEFVTKYSSNPRQFLHQGKWRSLSPSNMNLWILHNRIPKISSQRLNGAFPSICSSTSRWGRAGSSSSLWGNISLSVWVRDNTYMQSTLY